MRRVKEVMNPNVLPVEGHTSLREAALGMERAGTGIVPVVENDEVVGVLTERDIVVRAVAESRDPDSTDVREVMTTDLPCCFEDYDLDEALRVAIESRARNLLVLSRDGEFAGACSVRDLAVAADS